MEFFKFNPTGEQTLLERGEIINDLTSAVWVERYSIPGEFAFEAPLSSGLREFLPKGTLISHIDTSEVMIVENHEITETIEEDSNVIVTGRSFVSFLENRVIGMNLARTSSIIAPYILASGNTWVQLVTMISDHISDTEESSDGLDYIDVMHVTGLVGDTVEERVIDRGTVWERVAELLKVDDLGIKTVRREVGSTDTTIVIHQGVNRASTIRFSWKEGDLDSTNYLFSQKNEKNSAVVFGQYICVVVDIGPDKYDKRMMIVDATDIDGNFGSVPTGGDIFTIAVQLATRGLQTLAKQKEITITQADVSRTSRYQYRRDYNIGDLVTLDGNFNQSTVMRVVEFAEIEDENGESGHPTLALPGGE